MGPDWTVAAMAGEITMDHAQVFRSLRDAAKAGFLAANAVGRRVIYRPQHPALLEFLRHGVKYCFLPERGGLTRGMPTAHAAPVLAARIVPGGDPPPVWPDPEGEARGESFAPLHRCVPAAARRDPSFYAAMALVDALRGGRARERSIAAELLPEVLHGRHA